MVDLEGTRTTARQVDLLSHKRHVHHVPRRVLAFILCIEPLMSERDVGAN